MKKKKEKEERKGRKRRKKKKKIKEDIDKRIFCDGFPDESVISGPATA